VDSQQVPEENVSVQNAEQKQHTKQVSNATSKNVPNVEAL